MMSDTSENHPAPGKWQNVPGGDYLIIFFYSNLSKGVALNLAHLQSFMIIVYLDTAGQIFHQHIG
jgi:hypothetical protein